LGEVFFSDVTKHHRFRGAQIRVEAGNQVAVFGYAEVPAKREVGAFSVKLVFIPFVKVGDIALLNDPGVVGAVYVDFEFALVFLG
jgi:hypothetical protein